MSEIKYYILFINQGLGVHHFSTRHTVVNYFLNFESNVPEK